MDKILLSSNEDGKEEGHEKLKQRAISVLEECKKVNPQYHINGDKNIWILKPAQLSRGRGIKCLDSLEDIVNEVYGKKIPYVCQKYIENPLIINQKKFDIRQWVLVTDWCPLTIWFYDQCYIRFSAEEYDPTDLKNRFSHLTNNSIAKYSQNFETSEIQGNMWSMQNFIDYLKQLTSSDIFSSSIQCLMKHHVISSLRSVQDIPTIRRNSFEIYGFDFMIDSQLKPWLIEINSCPAMDYSTKVTEELVPRVLEDILKVVLGEKGDKGFECICRGKKLI